MDGEKISDVLNLIIYFLLHRRFLLTVPSLLRWTCAVYY